jgi:ProP effector
MRERSKNPLAAPLCAAWPKAFTNGPKPKPLKVGIHLDILSSGRFEAETVSKMLAAYTGRPAYLKALKLGADRVDLEGQLCGRVETEDEEHAKVKLARFKMRQKEKAKAAKAAKPPALETAKPKASRLAPSGRVILTIPRSVEC